MQRLAILSDTHWERWESDDPFAEALLRQLKQKEYHGLWHAGDVVHDSVLEALEQLAPLLCVKGNCDTFFARTLPHTVHRQIEDVRIGMIHGYDLPLAHPASLRARFPDATDLIIHGHTHRRRLEESRNEHGLCTIINPGSVTSPRGGEEPGFGELVVNGPVWSYHQHTLIL